jgi:hypothetical protein
MQAVASYKAMGTSKLSSPMMEDVSTPVDFTASPMKLSSSFPAIGTTTSQAGKRVRDLCKIARANSFDAALAAKGITRQHPGAMRVDTAKNIQRAHSASFQQPASAVPSRGASRSLLHAYEQLYNDCSYDESASALPLSQAQSVQAMVQALQEAQRWNLPPAPAPSA